jgi:hypothetical protein
MIIVRITTTMMVTNVMSQFLIICLTGQWDEVDTVSTVVVAAAAAAVVVVV